MRNETKKIAEYLERSLMSVTALSPVIGCDRGVRDRPQGL